MKIYISKSKVGNPDELMTLRHHLGRLDCEVTEFMGGTYNTNKLDEADILIVLGPSTTNYNIGKGQYTEVERFGNHNTWCNLFIVEHIDNKSLEMSEITGTDVTEKNWTSKYANIQLSDDTFVYEFSDFREKYKLEFKGVNDADKNVHHLHTLLATIERRRS